MSKHAYQSDGIIVPLAHNQGSPEQKQQRASNPQKSVWVGASAGSGKTKVLADRVQRLLLSGVPPQKILCLTFTRAAAAEMSIRITQQLKNWATCSDDQLRNDLDELQKNPPDVDQLKIARRLFARVLNCPGGMRIRTIHAFAQEVLRRFPLEAGLSPNFAVIEEAEANALWNETRDDLLQQIAESPGGELKQALLLLARERQEAGFNEILKSLTAQDSKLKAALRKAGGLSKLIAQMRGLLNLSPEDNEESLIAAAVADDVSPHARLKQAVVWLQAGSPTDIKRANQLATFLEAASENRIRLFDTYWRVFLTEERTIRARLATKGVTEKHPEITDILDREAVRLLHVVQRLENIRIAEQTAAVLVLAEAINTSYADRKLAQGVLDYNDLIERTDQLLRRAGIAPWVLYKLDGGIDHILVDEAQDTNPAQWNIVRALTEEYFSGKGTRSDNDRTLFVVGDEKQSIFSFHGADREKFEAMRDYFQRRITACDPAAYDEVPFDTSFRSAPAILRAVDAVFARDQARQGVAHAPIRHLPHRSEGIGHVEVWPLQKGQLVTKDASYDWLLPVGYEPEHDPAVILAEQLAQQIKHWCDGSISIYDRKLKQDRAATPGDIMILVRKRDKFVEHLVKALKTSQIPVTGIDRMQLTKQLAVMDLVAVLQFTLLPDDDLTLATVLRGPFLGCSEEQLMELALGRKCSLWQSLIDKPSFANLCDYLRQWLNEADAITPFAMLAQILNQPCPADTSSGRRAIWKRLGSDAQDPINELLNAAQDFSVRHAPSLQAFLHWLMETEAEIKREMDQGMEQVRITTIHAAKGLEAPIVIMPDTTTVPDKGKISKILWHPQYDVPFYVTKEPTNSMLRDLRHAERVRQLEEYRRLLYVALTRAADRLYICGWTAKQEKEETTEPSDGGLKEITQESCWYDLIVTALTSSHDETITSAANAVKPDIVFGDIDHRSSKTKRAITKTKDKISSPPLWLRQPVTTEHVKPRLKPSHGFEKEPAFASPLSEADGLRRFARGRLIHRLLQSLPDMPIAQQEAAATRFLANPQHDLKPEIQANIKKEVLDLLYNPAYAPLFGPESRAEVPLVGFTETHEIPGQVDRLCVRGDEVWVVDYKTNRPPPETVAEVPKIYQRQMAAYRAVLQRIYPTKTVRCFLLWTYKPCLMELTEEFLPAP